MVMVMMLKAARTGTQFTSKEAMPTTKKRARTAKAAALEAVER